MKLVLRGFKISLGLGVNFDKSDLIVINVDLALLKLVEDFHHCKIESLSFRYLGLHIGAN